MGQGLHLPVPWGSPNWIPPRPSQARSLEVLACATCGAQAGLYPRRAPGLWGIWLHYCLELTGPSMRPSAPMGAAHPESTALSSPCPEGLCGHKSLEVGVRREPPTLALTVADVQGTWCCGDVPPRAVPPTLDHSDLEGFQPWCCVWPQDERGICSGSCAQWPREVVVSLGVSCQGFEDNAGACLPEKHLSSLTWSQSWGCTRLPALAPGA